MFENIIVEIVRIEINYECQAHLYSRIYGYLNLQSHFIDA